MLQKNFDDEVQISGWRCYVNREEFGDFSLVIYFRILALCLPLSLRMTTSRKGAASALPDSRPLPRQPCR